ncbi:hypothetical protein BN946_scf184689.g1 [Trametes cinnabarina]|uniref:Uncharacterized protein n=1 Tax=Pycnoporus cinnabarinus TaxID=5643 RepID=A0A060SZ74_PYCCI|nr:hypothetical protein BN946_scf184689.g1 [Trametes cinnabarina]
MAATYTESKQLKATGPRAWWRAHFYDHPGYSETPRDPQSKTTGEHGKTKIWCKLCLQKRVGDEMQLDEQNGRHREAHEIEVFLWSLPSGQDERGYRWIASTSAAALLPKYTTRTTFPLVPIDVPNAAQRLTSQRQTLNTPAAWSQWPTQESLSKRPLRLLVAQVDHWPLPFLRSSFPMLLVRLPDPHFPLLLPLEDRHTRSRTSGLPTQALHLAHLRAYLVAMDQASGAFVIHLPHLVCMSDPLLLPLNVNHVVWVQEHFRVKPVSPSAWNPRQFLRSPLNANRCLSPSLRASLRRCVSLYLVENPIWIEFVEEFISGHSAPNPTPSRKVLTTRIIPGTVKQYRSIAQLACKAKLVTIQCDGFTAANRRHLVSFMVTCERKVERVVIDYFGVKTDIFIWTKQADELIRWLRSRTYVLGLLNEIQLGLPGASNHPPKTVILGALTRWTTMYLAYKRLLELKLPLEHLAAHPLLAASGNAESRQKTKDMLDRLKNPLFWYNLARVKLHLEPLAIAANITQSQDCRLDDVLLTFGFLYQSFNALVEERDNAVRTAVLGSLEKRWAKADQDVFIAAVILNPYLRLSPFRASLTQYFVPAAVYGLILRLWDRFYPDSTEKPTLSDVRDYLKFTPGSRYGSMPSILQHEKDEALRKGLQPDPVEIWKNFMPDVDPSEPQPTIPIDPPPLPALAIRILSICPSSAERTRLTTTNLLNIAELRLHLRDEQVRKDAKKRLKRHFGERVAQARAQSSNAPLEAPADDDESNGSALDDEQSQPGEPSRIRQAIREAQQGLQELIEYMRERDIEDSILTSDSFISTIRVPLATLFDFSNAYWADTSRLVAFQHS